MKFNKFIIVSIFLLAIISFGAVSAVSDSTIDDTVGESENIEMSASDDGQLTAFSEDISESSDVDDDSKLSVDAGGEKLSAGSVTPNYTIEVRPDDEMQGSNYIAQYGQIITVNGTLNNITGNVSIRFGYSGNYQYFTAPLVDGKFSQDITSYDKIRNNYNIQVTWAGNDYYKSISWSKNIHIQMNNVTANGTYYGLNPYVDVNLFNATGNVTFIVNGRNYTEKLVNGKLIKEFTNYTIGKNTVDMIYSGDDRFNPIERSFSFTVEANVEAPTIYNYQKAIINLYFGYATGKVNISLGNESYSLDIVNHAATAEFKNYKIGENTLNISYSGDVIFNPFQTTKTFTVLDKENAFIVSSVYKTAKQNFIFITIPHATGNITVTVNGKKEVWELVNETVIKQINASDNIDELIVNYTGNVRLNPTVSSFYVNLTDYIVNEKTWKNYFNQNDDGKLYYFIEDGVTLDFQGSIINPVSKNEMNIIINKPVNVISSTKDAYIDLNCTAGSLLGEHPGSSFVVNRGGSGSNISGIYLHNTELWISNTTNVVFDNISVVVEDQRVGSGVGATSVRDNSSYVTLKNSYFYTRNNGGSTTFTFSWAHHCIFDNNTVRAEGNVGNLLYLNVYNIKGAPTGVPLNTHNQFINNRVYGKEGSAISVGIMVEGAYNLIENNTCYKCSVSTSFGGVGANNNTYCGNTMTDGSSLTAQANSIVYNNNATGSLSTGANSIAYENDVGKTLTVGANSQAYNNDAGGLTVSGANAVAYSNVVTGATTVSGAGSEVYNNVITGNTRVTGANAKFHENNVEGTFTASGKNIQISNVNITGDVSIDSSNITVANSNISGAVAFTSAASACSIINNTIKSDSEYAIDLSTSKNNVIENNDVSSSLADGNGAIKSGDDSNVIEGTLPYDSNLTISIENMVAGKNTAEITVNINENATGFVRVIVNGKIYNVKPNKGVTSLTLNRNDFEDGEYSVIALYNGDGIYSSGQVNASFIVSSYTGKLDISVSDAKIGENAVVTVVLNSADDSAVTLEPSNNLQLIIDGEMFNVAFASGSNIANYTINNITEGKHSIVAIYNGEKGISYCENVTSFTLSKVTPNVDIVTGDLKIGEDVTVTVTVKDATGKVNIIVDGVSNIVDLTDGVANYTINSITEGKHTIVAVYYGEKEFSNSENVTSFTLSKVTPNVGIVTGDLKIGEDVTVTVTVKDATGKVNIIVDGVSNIVDLTDGVANYTIPSVIGGEHGIVAVYLGDESNNQAVNYTSFYLEEFATNFLNVTPSENGVSGVLVISTGDPLSNATIVYSINDIENTTTTDVNGLFVIPAAAGDNVYIIYEGDDAFLATSTSISLKNVAESRLASTIIVSPLTCYAVDYSAGERGAFFKFTLKDEEGNAIAGENVIVMLDNTQYTVKTDDDGVASVQVNIASSSIYTASVSFLGNNYKDASFATAKITVNKKPVTINAKASTFKAKAKTKKYTATLTTTKGSSADGKTYFAAGKTVTLKIKGKTYTAKTDKNGKVTFKITKLTKKGNHNAVISFAGDSTYRAVSKTVKIKFK